ncbi:heat shock transcription factor, Y-linked-like isoform 1-T1 [Acridotheres tristis]
MAMEREFLSLRFPQKLWKMLESGKFQSIWWSESGKCVAINKDLFEVEVLSREGQQVFHTQKIKSFMRQLNAYGFTKMQWNFQRSASLPEFLAEEAAASAHSQILYYFNPSFNRTHPWLSETCKRRGVLKGRGPDAEKMEERPL